MSVPEGSVTVLAPVPPPALHPSACPSWCKHRDHPAGHHFGPSVTWHHSREYTLPNTDPCYPLDTAIVRVELIRCDEDGETGETRLFVAGESDMELNKGEAAAFLAHWQAMLDVARVLHAQMDA